MSDKLKSLLNDLDSYDQDYEIQRWQLQVYAFLEHGYDRSVASTFSDLGNTNNVWDDSAKQKGYLEALLEKVEHSKSYFPRIENAIFSSLF